MKRYFRNIIAMLLAAVFVMSAVPAGALSVQPLDSMNVVTLTIPTDHDENQNGWGRPDLEFMGGWVHNGSWRKVIYCRDSRSGQVVYCIKPGRPINADTQYGDHDESYGQTIPATHDRCGHRQKAYRQDPLLRLSRQREPRMEQRKQRPCRADRKSHRHAAARLGGHSRRKG